MTPPASEFGGGYRNRALSPAQCHAVAAALANGIAPAALAAQYGVHRRTIYRAAAYGRSRWVRATVGEWAADFVLTEHGPVRCTPWYAA